MLERSVQGRATLGADRAYDTRDFVWDLGGRWPAAGRPNRQTRREYGEGGMSLHDCVNRILKTVGRFRMRPVANPEFPTAISPGNQGVAYNWMVLSAHG